MTRILIFLLTLLFSLSGSAMGANCDFGRWSIAANSGSKPFAMGIGEHLDDFARQHSATTWKQLDDVVDWKPGVLNKLSDPNQRVLFNLDDVDVWGGVSRAASGRGRATDWELLQIRQNDFPNLEFWEAGKQVPNPFK